MDKCKFCGEVARLVKSHIIPASFFRRIKDGPEPLEVHTSVSGEYQRKTRSGIYDLFMCLPCEKRFSKYDDYGARLLLNYRQHFQAMYDPKGKLVAYTTAKYNYALLKLFFISVLWRAAVASHKFYSKVTLGPYEEVARKSIETGNPGDEHHFSTFLSCWDVTHNAFPFQNMIMDPFEERWSNVRSYRLYFGELVAYIKVDRQHFPDPMAKMMLRDGSDLFIVVRDLLNSKDFKALHATVRKSKAND